MVLYAQQLPGIDHFKFRAGSHSLVRPGARINFFGKCFCRSRSGLPLPASYVASLPHVTPSSFPCFPARPVQFSYFAAQFRPQLGFARKMQFVAAGEYASDNASRKDLNAIVPAAMIPRAKRGQQRESHSTGAGKIRHAVRGESGVNPITGDGS